MSALRFVALRILQMIFTTFIAVSLVFLILHLMPGTPWNNGAASASFLLKNNWESAGSSYWRQLWVLWRNLLMGEWGYSITSPDANVLVLLLRDSKFTLLIGATAFFFSVINGIALAFLMALRPTKFLLNFLSFCSSAFLAMPSFLLAPLLILIFALELNWLPSALWRGPMSLVLPVLTLSLRPIFYIYNLLSLQIAEVRGKDFIKGAISRGVPTGKLLFVHVGKNAIGIVVSYLGALGSYLLSGSFLVETLFALPGWGYLFVHSLSERDYPVILGLSLIFSVLVQVSHLVSDFGLFYLNPQSRSSFY